LNVGTVLFGTTNGTSTQYRHVDHRRVRAAEHRRPADLGGRASNGVQFMFD
jgi:hypothetical protein